MISISVWFLSTGGKFNSSDRVSHTGGRSSGWSARAERPGEGKGEKIILLLAFLLIFVCCGGQDNRVIVATRGMDILLNILEQDRSDQEIVAVVLDILCIVMSDSDVIERSTGTSLVDCLIDYFVSIHLNGRLID